MSPFLHDSARHVAMSFPVLAVDNIVDSLLDCSVMLSCDWESGGTSDLHAMNSEFVTLFEDAWSIIEVTANFFGSCDACFSSRPFWLASPYHILAGYVLVKGFSVKDCHNLIEALLATHCDNVHILVPNVLLCYCQSWLGRR